MSATIELTPTLDSCIETTARREFSRSRDEYLSKGGDDNELAERVGTLGTFLETADFRRLRSESERHLTEGRTVRFSLHPRGERVEYEMKVDT